jgi:hypothetical protein
MGRYSLSKILARGCCTRCVRRKPLLSPHSSRNMTTKLLDSFNQIVGICCRAMDAEKDVGAEGAGNGRAVMRFANTTARFAIVAALALIVSVGCTSAQRTALLNNNGPEKDPNMPPLSGPIDVPLSWTYGDGTQPYVEFKNPASQAPYMGFNENGSMVRNAGDGKIYYWKMTNFNIATATLTVAFKSYQDIPLEVLAALKNPSHTVKEKLEMNAPTGAVNKALLVDPNFPALNFMNEGPVYWTYGVSSRPTVSFKLPAAEAYYLGFNEKGSMLQNKANGKVFYWKLSNPQTAAGTLMPIFDSIFDIPVPELESLKNTDQAVRSLLAKKGAVPKPGTVAQQPPPQNSDKSGGIFGDNPQKTLQGVAPAAASAAPASPYEIAGKDAVIKAGVLTFTLVDGSKSKSYTVVRPGFMANAPQAAGAGISGTWVATGSGGKGILFTVTTDNSVTGKEISPQVLQMMTQGAK